MLRWSPALPAVLVFAACAPPSPVVPTPAPQALSAIERPIPYPMVPPARFRRAVEAGTRTTTGAPGPAYWTNTAAYRLRARVLVPERRLEGEGEIVYTNRSPAALPVLHLELTMNHHAPGAERNVAAEVTGGVRLHRVTVNGRELEQTRQGVGYRLVRTRFALVLPEPIEPGATARITVDWDFDLPASGIDGRVGYSGDEVFFLAYWYPHMVVYDDVDGWHPPTFRGNGEFYHGFADYDVEVDAPAGWVVRATGELANVEEVLAPAVVARLRTAAQSDTPVRVVDAAAMRAATLPGRDGRLVWRFRAENVRDVAFSLTSNSNWDVARAPAGRRADGGAGHTRVEALWRDTAPVWAGATGIARHALPFFADVSGIPYPWPHFTAVEGEGIGAAMEYPMMNLLVRSGGEEGLYDMMGHGIGHMWAPMIVSSDERRYAWMDEGIAVHFTAVAMRDRFGDAEAEARSRNPYLALARTGAEGEVMRITDFHDTDRARHIASYDKPAVAFTALRGLLGEETFGRAWRAFFERWAYRHPQPWDLFNTFEDVSGEDLEWFWRTWFYETWLLDQAVASVTEGPGGTTIVVEDRGDAPMPARLTVTRADGSVARAEVPVSTWLSGARRATVTLPAAASPVVRVEIDAENHFPDADRENNVWVRGS